MLVGGVDIFAGKSLVLGRNEEADELRMPKTRHVAAELITATWRTLIAVPVRRLASWGAASSVKVSEQ
jgi:hypothetical protein